MIDIEGRYFKDEAGRTITLRGINFGGHSKLPVIPDGRSHLHDHFFEADDVDFVDINLSPDNANIHFARIKSYGFNTVRLVVTWEAIEHAGPKKYDDAYVDYVISIIQACARNGLYVFIDPHQDVWSRFTGGSGAPYWTLIAAGLNPRGFEQTEAAIVHNTYPDPEDFPKMIWATNYHRMACQTMFTLFFGGRDFCPWAIIDGINIQDYLQEHFLNAIMYLCVRIHDTSGLENFTVIGWENLNEPHPGFIGHENLDVLEEYQRLRLGTTPTPYQGIQLASGMAVKVATYSFGRFGPYKTGSVTIDPKGQSAWLRQGYCDRKYGWKRDEKWILGKCIWARSGIWDPASGDLLKPNYFASDRRRMGSSFVVDRLVPFVQEYTRRLRAIHQKAILFLQPPVLEMAPDLRGEEAEMLSPFVYCPHFYDGFLLVLRKWNTFMNVDALGITRGHYKFPYLAALRFGEKAIRSQFQLLRDEGLEQLGILGENIIAILHSNNEGEVPCLISETGICYDLDNKASFRTGNYKAQYAAMDTHNNALESSALSYTLWNYCIKNNHEWGDQWNGEDLSIWSANDDLSNGFTALRSNIDVRSVTGTTNGKSEYQFPARPDLMVGSRALEAFVRPSPIAVAGIPLSYGYSLETTTFELKVLPDVALCKQENKPTEIFVPVFILKSAYEIVLSSGRYEIDVENQIVLWWHEGCSEQTFRLESELYLQLQGRGVTGESSGSDCLRCIVS